VRRCSRLFDDRGISDSWSVTQESGSLWVNYDRIPIWDGWAVRVMRRCVARAISCGVRLAPKTLLSLINRGH